MKKVIVLIFVLLFVVACGNNGDEADTTEDVPGTTENEVTSEEADETAEGGEAPRAEATPDSGIPPTNTPTVREDGGHLFRVGGGLSQIDNFSGTRIIHIIEPGETLAMLCERYGVSVEDLARINNISNVNHVEVGQALTVPLPITNLHSASEEGETPSASDGKDDDS